MVFGGSAWIAEAVFSDPALAGPLRLMSLGIPCMSLLTLHAELLKGLRRIRDAVLVQGLGVQLISLPVLLLLGGPFGVYGAVLAFLSANLMVFLLGVVLWRRATPQIRGVRGAFETRLLMGTSVPLMWVVAMNLVMTWTDMVMIGIYMDSEWVGIYGACLRLALLTDFVLVAVNSIAAPKFATLHARGEQRALNNLATNAARLTALLALPPSLVFLIVPEFVLGIFGEQFRVGASSLAILGAGQFVSVAIGSVGYLLIMTGREKAERNIAISFAALNVILNFVLIPMLGIEGAAISTGMCLAVRNLVAYAVWRRMRNRRGADE
jgi:O-antigen/teichoic acid export membrane protein